MGQKQIKEEEKTNNLLDNYLLKRSFFDDIFGDVTIIENVIDKEEFLLKELTASNESDFNLCLAELKKRNTIFHPNIIKILGFTDKSINQYCSKFYKIKIILEFAEKTLNQEISERILSKNFYTEIELQEIVSSLISVLAFLQKNNINHGDVVPSNVLISIKNSIKTYKITDQSFFKKNNTFMQLIVNKNFMLKTPYISPALLKAIENNIADPSHNRFKSDVFSLGITILHAGLFENCDNIYNFPSYKIEKNQLDLKIQKFSQKYTRKLSEIVKNMCEIDENLRLDFIELESVFNSSTPISKFAQNKVLGNLVNKYLIDEYDKDHSSLTKILKQNDENINVLSNDFRTEKFTFKEARNFTKKVSLLFSDYGKLEDANSINTSFNERKLERNSYDFVKIVYEEKSLDKHEHAEDNPLQNTQKKTNVNEENYNSLKKYNINYDDIEYWMKKYDLGEKDKNNEYSSDTNTKNRMDVFNLMSNYSENFEEKKMVTPQQDRMFEGDYYNKNIYEKNQELLLNNEKIIKFDFDNNNLKDLNETKKKFEPITIYSNFEKNSTINEPRTINKNFENFREKNPTISDKNIYSNFEKNAAINIPQNNTNPHDFEYNYPLKKEKNFDLVLNYNNVPTNTNETITKKINYNISKEKNEKLEKDYMDSLKSKQNFNSDEIKVVIEKYQNGSRYEGEKKGKFRDGKGKLYYNDGGIYDGEWKKGRMHGSGVLYYSSGNWVENKFQGRGTLYNEFPVFLNQNFNFQNFENLEDYWVKYEGNFVDDCKEGYGIIYLTNGEKYAGNFENDCVHGKGTFFSKDGKAISGFWNNNIFQN